MLGEQVMTRFLSLSLTWFSLASTCFRQDCQRNEREQAEALLLPTALPSASAPSHAKQAGTFHLPTQSFFISQHIRKLIGNMVN